MTATQPKIVTASREPTLTPISFEVQGDRIVGALFRPAASESQEPQPAIIVDGPWTQVKEQVGYRYGRALAERGLTALAIDHRNWGESGGQPRSLESTRRKVTDLQGALDFLQDAAGIDGDRIGALGVCAGAGIVTLLAARDHRVRSMATVAAFLQHPTTTPLFYGGDEGVARRIALAEAARERYEQTGKIEYVLAYDPSEGSDAAMFFPLDYYGNPRRGAVPTWRNEFAVMGWKEWLELDTIEPAARVNVPVLVVHSDGSALPDNVRRFFDRLAGRKDLLWTQGEHTEFYDAEPQVVLAADTVAAHFRRTLHGTAAS